MKNLNLKMFFVGMVVILAGMMFLPATGFSANLSIVPEYKITPLPNNAPAQLKKLLGTWGGKWVGYGQRKIEAYLTVTKIDIKQKKVWMVYAWEPWDNSGLRRAYVVGKLSFSDSKSEIKFGRKYGPKFEFVLRKGKKVLEGTRTQQSSYIVISMHKVH